MKLHQRHQLIPSREQVVRIQSVTFFVGLLCLLFVAVPVAADDVYLENGQVFEGVVAVEGLNSVMIRLEIGQLTLPKSQVQRVVKEASSFEEFLTRSNTLRASSEASALDWMSLANWARSRELSEGYRSAALMAAKLAPDLEGVAVAMRRIGYELDERSGDWVPFEEAMRRQGMVHSDGEWIPVAEAKRRSAAVRQAREEAPGRVEAQQPAAPASGETNSSDVALAQVELLRDMMGKNVGVASGVAIGSYGVPALPLSGSFGVGPSHRSISQSTQRSWDILSVRQPGSILPMSSYRRPGQ